MISSSVVYGHPVKYSNEIPNKYLSGSMSISLLAYAAIFWDSFTFRKAICSHIFSSTSITKVIFSEQLFLQSSCLFWGAPFLEQSLFPTIIFSEYLLFQSEPSTQKPDLESRKFFSAVTFQNSYSQKTSTEELLFRSRFFCTTSTFSKTLEKATFPEKKNSHHLLFLESYLCIAFFINCYLLLQLHFYKRFFITRYHFRRVTISQIPFLSTATRPIN